MIEKWWDMREWRPTMSDWIPIEDRLPKIGNLVWLAVHGSITYVTIAKGEGEMVVEKWWDMWNVDSDGECVDIDGTATHWQPFVIPEPPKEPNDD